MCNNKQISLSQNMPVLTNWNYIKCLAESLCLTVLQKLSGKIWAISRQLSKKMKKNVLILQENSPKPKNSTENSYIIRPHDFYVTLEIQKAAVVWYCAYVIVVTMFNAREPSPTLGSLPCPALPWTNNSDI